MAFPQRLLSIKRVGAFALALCTLFFSFVPVFAVDDDFVNITSVFSNPRNYISNPYFEDYLTLLWFNGTDYKLTDIVFYRRSDGELHKVNGLADKLEYSVSAVADDIEVTFFSASEFSQIYYNIRTDSGISVYGQSYMAEYSRTGSSFEIFESAENVLANYLTGYMIVDVVTNSFVDVSRVSGLLLPSFRRYSDTYSQWYSNFTEPYNWQVTYLDDLGYLDVLNNIYSAILSTAIDDDMLSEITDILTEISEYSYTMVTDLNTISDDSTAISEYLPTIYSMVDSYFQTVSSAVSDISLSNQDIQNLVSLIAFEHSYVSTFFEELSYNNLTGADFSYLIWDIDEKLTAILDALGNVPEDYSKPTEYNTESFSEYQGAESSLLDDSNIDTSDITLPTDFDFSKSGTLWEWIDSFLHSNSKIFSVFLTIIILGLAVFILGMKR